MPLLEAQLCGAPVIHGRHGSMQEAAGGLGVATGTDVADLHQMFEDLANGRLPLACRLPEVTAGQHSSAASRVWCEFEAATRQHKKKP